MEREVGGKKKREVGQKIEEGKGGGKTERVSENREGC